MKSVDVKWCVSLDAISDGVATLSCLPCEIKHSTKSTNSHIHALTQMYTCTHTQMLAINVKKASSVTCLEGGSKRNQTYLFSALVLQSDDLKMIHFDQERIKT